MHPTVGVFYSKKSGGWIHLPATSDYFNSHNWIPTVGDRIAICGPDIELLKDAVDTTVIDSSGILARETTAVAVEFYKTVVTVKERIFNYSLCEIALVCEYIPF